MSKKEPNKPIGRVKCPIVGCTEQVSVFKFKARSQNEATRRWAGKVYCHCPAHGSFGTRGEQAIQEYIMDNGEIWGERSDDETAPPIEAAGDKKGPADKQPEKDPPKEQEEKGKEPKTEDDWWNW